MTGDISQISTSQAEAGAAPREECVIECLMRARESEAEIGVQQEHLDRLERIARMKHSSLEYAAEIAEKLARVQREFNELIDRSYDAKRRAISYITYLTGEEYSVIFSYYILAKDWRRIADDLYMSERRVYLLRKSALEKLSRRFDEERAV